MTFEKAKFELFEREEQAIDDKNHDPDNEYLEGVADGLHEAAKLLFSVELVDVSDYIDRQAAINLVESFYKIDKSALNLMVFELKQLPPAQADVPDTNVGDTISRQAAIEAVGYYSLHSGDKLLFADKPLKELPSVQPECKKGKWIKDRLVSTNGGTYGVRRCSECEAYYQDVGYGWSYCPNCGADMRGET